ncbi:MAG: hypothetical protein CMJ83_15610 [Planctomycetes bacterium]|nr:hypothetical protein [Planctomycetota bacterium]
MLVRRRTAALLLLLILGALGVGWWLLASDGGEGQMAGLRGGGPDADGNGDAPPHPALEVRAPGAEKGVATSRFDASHDFGSEVGQPIVPDYGPLIERTVQQVAIRLIDGHGHAVNYLGFRSGAARVWRRQGAHWQRAAARFGEGYQTVLFGDVGRDTLEPGAYESVVGLGSYGKASVSFDVGRGEIPSPIVKLPGYQRVVTLKFVDADGNPVPFITHPPRFIPAATPALGSRPRPDDVLRTPTGAHFSDQVIEETEETSEEAVQRFRYPTDDGRYSVRVVAGTMGTLEIELDPLVFSRTLVRVRGDFVGAAWDERLVELPTRSDYAKAIAGPRTIHLLDPGRRSLRGAAPLPSSSGWKPRRLANPFDVESIREGHFRVVISGTPGDARHPRFLVDGRPASVSDFLRAGDHRWGRDFTLASRYSVLESDGAFHHSAPRRIEPADRKLVRLTMPAAGAPCTFSLNSTPTFAAWARAVSFGIESKEPVIFETSVLSQQARAATRTGSRHRYDSSLTNAWRDALLASPAVIHAAFAATAQAMLANWYFATRGRPVFYGPGYDFTLPLTSRDRQQLVNGHLELDLVKRIVAQMGHRTLLVFRCVGDADEGLLFAEGSIVSAESDRLARTIREASGSLAKTGLRPGRSHLQVGAAGSASEEILEQEPEEVADVFDHDDSPRPHFVPTPPQPMPELDELRRYVSEDARNAYGDDGLRRLWSKGAWYDTYRRVRSDDNGYVTAKIAGLKPGRLYVLYLWSRSRDDLKPDRRIVFRAKAGITDLGALRLPSH